MKSSRIKMAIGSLSRKTVRFTLLGMLGLAAAPYAFAGGAPSHITVGCLYAKTGFLSYQSMKLHHGLEFWAHEVNAKGGAYVKAYHKRIPIKLKCYNDRSDTSLVPTLVNRLINHHVDVLVSDTSSLLTAPAVPVARARKMLLINPQGTSRKFYTKNNPYIVQTSDLVTRYWAHSISHLLLHLKVKRVAIVYGTNDFDGPQAQEVNKILSDHGVKPVYFEATPTTTSNYTSILHKIASVKPQAVLELGYDPNDVTFLKNMQESGYHFDFVYTLFPSMTPREFKGLNGPLKYTFCYVTSPTIPVSKVTEGLTTAQFSKKFKAWKGDKPQVFQTGGYVAGLVVQRALATASGLKQLQLRKALAKASGKMVTVAGTFRITKAGAQTGVVQGIGQFMPTKSGLKMKIVYPAKYAQAKPVYPAPKG